MTSTYTHVDKKLPHSETPQTRQPLVPESKKESSLCECWYRTRQTCENAQGVVREQSEAATNSKSKQHPVAATQIRVMLLSSQTAREMKK
ncbi:hypothetical protein ACLKA6_007957 [Drosophila palustris]